MSKQNSTFGATDQRVYVVNSRLPVFDFNTEVIRQDICNNVVPQLNKLSFTGPTGAASLRVSQQGPLSITGTIATNISGQTVNVGNFPTYTSITGLAGITGSVAVTNFPSAFSVSGPVGITGPVGVTGSVSVLNFPSAFSVSGPIGITGGITGSVAVTNFPSAFSVSGPVGITGPVGVTGSVSVLNFPSAFSVSGPVSITGGITGSVAVTNFPSAFSVSGPVSITGGITGSVAVTNFPTEFSVSGPIGITGGITGSVAVTNFPTSFSVSGPVGITGGITGSVAVTNFPTSFSVSGPVGITGGITGSVAVTNFPTAFSVSGPVGITGGITGSVTVTNFPTEFSVSGPIGITGGITGSVAVTNFPTAFSVSGPVGITGGITGSVAVTNFPTAFSVSGPVGITGGITGSVAVTNFPTAFSVSGPVGITGLVGITGSFASDISGQYVNISNFPSAYSVSGPVSITGPVGITGSVAVNNFPAAFSISGPVGITGLVGITGSFASDISGQYVNISNKVGLTGPIYGLDDTGVQYPFYVDANGIQRTEVIPKSVQDAKYIYETDSTLIGATAYVLDSRERPGWYLSGNVTSTLKWYAGNGISNPPSLAFNKLQAVYWTGILDTLDAKPTLQVKTADGSTYTYSTGAHPIYNGQQYLFYYGTKAINLHPELHPYLLTRTGTGPQGNTSIITEINIVTAAGSNPYNFLLDSAGLWNQDNLEHYEVFFRDIRAQTAEDNLIALDFSGTALKTLSQGQDYNSSIYPIYADQYGVQRQQPVLQTAVHPYLYTQAVNDGLVTANVLQNDPYYNNPGWLVAKTGNSVETMPVAGNNIYNFNISGGTVQFKFGSLDSLYWIGWIHQVWDAGAAQYTLPVLAVSTGGAANILQYAVTDPTKVIGGRKYLFAYNSTKARQLHPELPCIELTRSIYSGLINPNDPVDYILHASSLVANSRVYNYGVELAGYYDLSLGTMQEYSYTDLREFNATTNLDTLDFSGTSLKVYDTNLRGTFDSSLNGITSTVVSTKRGLDTNIINSTIRVDISGITIANNRLPTTADISGVTLSTGRIPVVADISGVTLSSGALSVVDSSCSGLLNTINQGIGYSFVGNVYGNVANNATVTAGAFSTYATWTRGQYNRNTVFTYLDTATASTDSVSIFTKATNGTALFLGQFFPININARRRFCCTLNLAPFDTLAIFNGSASTISGVDVTIASA